MTAGEPKQSRRGLIEWLRAHMHGHRARLISIDDTPHSIALGSAIGMFFGLTPLFGLKTLLSIVVAWLFKSNKIAAAITVTLHDLILPAAPFLLRWQYQIGMWLLHGTVPRRFSFRTLRLREYVEWTTFFTVGQPTLIGSLVFALPSAVIVYFFVRALLFRARTASAKKAAASPPRAEG